MVEGQNFSSEVTFAKGAGGESAAVGQYVSDGAGTRISGGRVYNQVIHVFAQISCMQVAMALQELDWRDFAYRFF